jgi:hypothetical protein
MICKYFIFTDLNNSTSPELGKVAAINWRRRICI